MINDTVIKNYVEDCIKDYIEDYIINNDDFDVDPIVENIDAIVEQLHRVALANAMTIEQYADCDAFPSDDFAEAFELAANEA